MNDLFDILILYFSVWAIAQVIIAVIFAEKNDGDEESPKKRRKSRAQDDKE